MTMSSFSPLKPKVVLGVAAHPDDLDFGASGTMASFANNGADVHYLILTDGGKGTNDRHITSEQLTKIRQKEQQNALLAIGGKSVSFLAYPDGYLEVTMELKKDIVSVIRKLRPDVVITMDPSMLYSTSRGFINHPDHRAAGQATLDAVFPLARDLLAYPELALKGLMPHKTSTVLLTNFDNHNYIVDITKTFHQKIAALKAHTSQTKNRTDLEKWLRQVAKNIGQPAGYELAEAFIRLDIQN